MKPVSSHRIPNATSDRTTINYPEFFGLLAPSAVLANNQSDLWGGGFVSQMVISDLRAIKRNPSVTLCLGRTPRGEIGFGPSKKQRLFISMLHIPPQGTSLLLRSIALLARICGARMRRTTNRTMRRIRKV
jgi:hypothetical protein